MPQIVMHADPLLLYLDRLRGADDSCDVKSIVVAFRVCIYGSLMAVTNAVCAAAGQA